MHAVMRMPQRFPQPLLVYLLSLIAAGISACGGLQPRIEPGQVQFQDDFSRTNSGWDRFREATYWADYHNGGYQIQIEVPNTEVWSLPRLTLEDTQLSVEATKIAGPDNNVYGLLCRYQDARNFVFFLISSDGYAGIGHYRDGEKILLTGDSMLPSDAIMQGGAPNFIRAYCVNNELKLIVNQELVAEARDENVQPGDVGLIAGSYDEGGVAIRFDQFSSIQP